MPKVGASIKGDKQLLRTLEALGKKAAPKVNRRAVNLATTPILSAAKSCVPVDHGDLKKAMAKKVYNRGFNANGIVGADANYVVADGAGFDERYLHSKVKQSTEQALKALKTEGADLTRPAKYDHLVEYGHNIHGGGTVPPHPFLRPAWDSSIGTARETYERELAAGIEKEAAKGAR